jgi:hypothetical protein
MKPLTLREIMTQLEDLAAARPEVLEWPVHILDMETRDGKDDPDERLGALVTLVETDCYSKEQGNVVSLVAWRSAK